MASHLTIAQFTPETSNLGTDTGNALFTVLDIVLQDVDLFFFSTAVGQGQ